MPYYTMFQQIIELTFNCIGVLFFIEFVLSFFALSVSNILKHLFIIINNKILLIYNWFDRELGIIATGILWGFYLNYLIQGKFWKQRNIFYIYLLSLPLIFIPAWWPMDFNYNLVPYFYNKTTLSIISAWYELLLWPGIFAGLHIIFWPIFIMIGLFIIVIYCLLWYLFSKNIFILYKSGNSNINTNTQEQENEFI